MAQKLTFGGATQRLAARGGDSFNFGANVGKKAKKGRSFQSKADKRALIAMYAGGGK